MDKQKVLDVLNGLNVVEQYGGDDFSILVESSEGNFRKLEEVGISRELALSYGDEELFCIAALAFGEGYADVYIDGKLRNLEYEFDCLLEKIIHNAQNHLMDKVQKDKEKLLNLFKEVLNELSCVN